MCFKLKFILVISKYLNTYHQWNFKIYNMSLLYKDTINCVRWGGGGGDTYT